jgi:manganese-dependent ADP-ribose/CDP-alcohol diphosphatase
MTTKLIRLLPNRMAVTLPPRAKLSLPLFSFGVIADIQYADKPLVNGRDRYEKDAIIKLKASLEHWMKCHTSTPLSCVVNLGDIIDGHEGEGAIEKDRRDLHDVLDALATIDLPKYHVLGNHCVWNLGCKYLTESLGMPHRFYDIPMARGWRFVFLDGTDMSLMKESHSMEEAQEYFKLHSHRMLEDWNGGFSAKQQQWLKQVMQRAKRDNEKLILFCHWPLINLWTPYFDSSLLWNASDVLQILDPEVVFMFMSGHMHENGYAMHNGIHHLTLGAVVTTPHGLHAHAVVHVGEDGVDIEGFGALAPLSSTFSVTKEGKERLE